jgi:hypothetical protein
MNVPEPDASPVPRGARPDAETAGQIHLVKNVSELRATYQVRLLAVKAAETRKVLILRVPRHCRFAADLQSLVAARPGLILRETLP